MAYSLLYTNVVEVHNSKLNENFPICYHDNHKVSADLGVDDHEIFLRPRHLVMRLLQIYELVLGRIQRRSLFSIRYQTVYYKDNMLSMIFLKNLTLVYVGAMKLFYMFFFME